MKIETRALTAVAILALASALTASQGPAKSAAPANTTSPAVQELATRLERRVPELMDMAAVPGAQLAVIQGGKAVWTRSFGVANSDTGTPVTDASVFEAASLSKPVFAYAVLKLADAGKIDLDTPLVTYLPGRYDVDGDDRVKLITARHVLEPSAPGFRTGGPAASR